MNASQPITILIAALGGEGGGVLSEWLVELATLAGHPAQATSIPGVAQRTGATTYYVEIHPRTLAESGGREPVMSLSPVPGCIDLMVASELLEAVRAIQNGYVSPQRTRLVCSTHRTLTTSEKLVPGDGRYDSESLLAVAGEQCKSLAAFDVDATARDTGTVPSAVLFGAICASGVLPFGRDAFEAVVRASGRGIESSLRGFALAMERAQPKAKDTDALPPAASGPAKSVDMVNLGHARVVEYQDDDYGEIFLRRVERLRAVARRFGAAEDGELVSEGARFLALWMCYDDVIRVADLKSSASRYRRVADEAGVRAGNVLRIADHLKPGEAEFAGLLPKSIAEPLLAWSSRRRQRGAAALSWRMSLRSDTVAGFLALRLLASLRPWRPAGSRHAEEQALIEDWLSAVEGAASVDVALELALCARIIKGYGETNERAKESFRCIINHLKSNDAAAIRRARIAALDEESGKALDAELLAAGAPPRPVRAVPVRWMKRTGHAT